MDISSAHKSSYYQKLQWVDTVPKVTRAVKELKKQKEIALDCEGFSLGRKGTLDIVTIGTMNKKVFLFDITQLKSTAFDHGLRDLLQSDRDTMTKLMFDCRNDSDALLHLFNVKLDGVLDLQVVDYLRRKGMKKVNEDPVAIRGLDKIIDGGVASLKSRIGDQIKNASIRGQNIWIARPLGPELENYCALDVLKLFEIRKVFKNTIKKKGNEMFGESKKRLASEGL